MNDVTANPALPATTPRAGTAFWAETRATALLALPIVAGQIIQNSLGVIDTFMVGRVSVQSVAAASLGTAIFVVPLVFGFGLIGPFSVLVSGAHARENHAEAAHHLRRGMAVSLGLGVIMAVIISAACAGLDRLHEPPDVVALTRPFLRLLAWSILPMYLFATLKQYCEALHNAWPPMLLLGSGVFVNVILNWILIYGHLGAPKLGLTGAGWATLATRTLLFLALAVAVGRMHFRHPAQRTALFRGRFHWQGYREFLAMGVPASLQVILDVGTFTFAAVMMGWISEAALAAHQVGMVIASTTFMAPLGLSFAVAIRVSHALGRGEAWRARLCVHGSLLMTLAIMSVSALATCALAPRLAGWFIHDPKVVPLAGKIVFIAGLFQVFDGIQIVCVGALRGLKDIIVPGLLNFAGYWMLGIPICYVLGFPWHFGPLGIWSGLTAGIVGMAAMLLARLRHQLHALATPARPGYR